MKKLILLFLVLSLFSCWNNSNEYQSDYYQDEEAQKECLEPENPYSEWSWHYAWYERAVEKWRTCSWNSNSFIEWCEEYYSQESDYENCIN